MDLQDIESFRNMFGRRADRTLTILGELFKEFERLYGTEVGREILKEDVERYNTLADEAIKRNLSDLERVELTYLQKRISTIVEKLDKYFQLLNKIEDRS